MEKNKMLIYDCDTIQFIPNHISSPSFKISKRIINDKVVSFGKNLAYDEIIYDSEKGDMAYAFSYAYLYDGKLVALGECPGRCAGGITDYLVNNPKAKQIVESLSKQDPELYKKIKDKEIAHDIPTSPKTVYCIKDSKGNNFCINDNNDNSYSLWRKNYYDVTTCLITSKSLPEVIDKLFKYLNIKTKCR